LKVIRLERGEDRQVFDRSCPALPMNAMTSCITFSGSDPGSIKFITLQHPLPDQLYNRLMMKFATEVQETLSPAPSLENSAANLTMHPGVQVNAIIPGYR
jgi:hypothetical protein